MKTNELLARLQRHYIVPGAVPAGGVFLPEVGWNGTAEHSRADALYIGFTGSSGRILKGHELKVSRSDWLAELAKVGKADPWADQCHEWWLVTLPDVVRDGELPEGWGLMIPGRSKTRMQVVQKPRTFADRTPSWDAMRSITARLDTLQTGRLNEVRRQAEDKATAAIEGRVEVAIANRLRQQPPDYDDLMALLVRYENALGVASPNGSLTGSWSAGRFDEALIKDIQEGLRLHGTVQKAVRNVVGQWRVEQAKHAQEAAGDLVKALESLEAGSAFPDGGF